MKRDTIDNAIARGAGTGEADNMEELTYEGYASGGVAVLVGGDDGQPEPDRCRGPACVYQARRQSGYRWIGRLFVLADWFDSVCAGC